MRHLRGHLIAGVLVTAPIAITLYIAWAVISWIDSNVTPLIPDRYNPETYLPFDVPGLGVVIVVLGLIAIGAIADRLVGRWIVHTTDLIVQRLPIISGIYTTLKQVFELVFGKQSKAMQEVVRVEFPRAGSFALGFVTGRPPAEIDLDPENPKINVFVPTAPNPTTGFLLFVPRREAITLDLTVEEGMKHIVSGGLVRSEPDWKSAPASTEPEIGAPTDDVKREHRMLGHLRRHFLTGMLVTAPIGITAYFAWHVTQWVDGVVWSLLPAQMNPEQYLKIAVPGFGLLVVLVGLTILGSLAAGLLGRAALGMTEHMFRRMPVICGLYTALKQIIGTVFGAQSEAFREVVLCVFPRPGAYALGFLTGSYLADKGAPDSKDLVNVFVPTTPNPTSGFTLIVPRSELTNLAMTVEEGIKMVISAGIVVPPDRRAAQESYPDRTVRTTASRSKR